jgi:hypothetical protein
MTALKESPAAVLKRLRAETRHLTQRQGQQRFLAACRAHDLPLPITEFVFHPTRRWRFDYCFVDQRLAVEVQGGLFVAGRHSRGAALLGEHEKLNAAAVLGYRVLYVVPKALGSPAFMRALREALFS